VIIGVFSEESFGDAETLISTIENCSAFSGGATASVSGFAENLRFEEVIKYK
jgi:hypothetical protein